MGAAASKERKFFRPFDAGEFTVAWLTFKGDATEDDAHRLMARKAGLLSSKLLRGLFGEATMNGLERTPGDRISKEAFVCTLALCYVGNTEDRISYVFSMYAIIYAAEPDDGFIYETDYLYLLEHLESVHFVPRKFYAAFEECRVPMGSTLTNAQFVDWVRQYPTLMDYLATHLPPSPLPSSPLSIRTTDDPNVDPLNHSPSCRASKLKASSGAAGTGSLGPHSSGSHFSSFDFLGGEDSGDDDDSDDELYDSDEVSESYHDDDAPPSDSLDDASVAATGTGSGGLAMHASRRGDDSDPDSREPTARAAPPTPLSVSRHSDTSDRGFGRSSNAATRASAATLRSRGVQKMGRNIGKAVGGGISKVGRTILHVGKSQVHSNSTVSGGPTTAASNTVNSASSTSSYPVATAKAPMPNNASSSSSSATSTDQHSADAATSLLAAGYAFSSESQTSKSFVCGYVHKVSDGKWSKRSWHRRWFVLDKQRGVLSYYRSNPANLLSAAPHGNVVHMDARDDDNDNDDNDNDDRGRGDADSERASREAASRDAADTGSSGTAMRLATQHEADTNSKATGSARQTLAGDDKPTQQHLLLFLCTSHPWYRGELDLTADNVSLLFEKSLAKNAPTSYFFQVSTLALHEIDSKRGVQYKLCADNEADFDLWTHAIATAINRKHTLSASQQHAPVLSHQQLYRQRLLQEQEQQRQQQHETGATTSTLHATTAVITPTSSAQRDAVAGAESADSTTPTPVDSTAAAQPRVVKPVPPPIVTNYRLANSYPSSTTARHSPWRLDVTVEGTKPCLILGFVVNMVAMKVFATEHVVSKCVVCVVVTAAYVASIYNPRPRLAAMGWNTAAQTGSTGTGSISSATSVSADVDAAQCVDPTVCCLHRDGATTTAALPRTPGPATPGTTTQVAASASPVGPQRVTKFAMASSMAQTHADESGRSTNVSHAWATTRGETFAVRSLDYKKTRRKEASQPALFEFVGCDLIRTDSKVDRISQRVELPEELAADKLFIVNAQLPAYAPSVWGDASSNGPGFSLVLYWKIPSRVLEDLKDPQTPALRLLKRFLCAADHADTSLTDRFKVIAQVTNQDECGVTGMGKKLLASHNATPVLTRPQHRLYPFNDGSLELVVDIHAFSYIARRGIHLLLDKTAKLVIDIGVLLQGETDDELPEQILGCCRLDHADVQFAMDMPR